MLRIKVFNQNQYKWIWEILFYSVTLCCVLIPVRITGGMECTVCHSVTKIKQCDISTWFCMMERGHFFTHRKSEFQNMISELYFQIHKIDEILINLLKSYISFIHATHVVFLLYTRALCVLTPVRTAGMGCTVCHSVTVTMEEPVTTSLASAAVVLASLAKSKLVNCTGTGTKFGGYLSSSPTLNDNISLENLLN